MNMMLDELLKQCTVKIVTNSSLGTGFFVGPGYVLTCAHVVEAANDAAKTHIEVFWGDQCCDAVVEGIQVKEISVRQLDREITYPYPDLALLRITFSDHPCVCLRDEHISAKDNVSLLSYGYIEGYPEGDPSKFQYIGESSIGASKYLLKFQGGQASAGLSGAPLLNLKTNCVCGVVQSSLDAHKPWGGRGIPTSTVFETFPQLKKFQEEYLSRENPWRDLPPLKERFWLVPYQRNPYLIGRDQVLTQLHTELTTKESPLPQAINGLSGIGKTQIALEYAYRYRSEYQAVFWVSADSYPTRVSDLVNIARELHLPKKNVQDQDRTIETVKSWLQDHQNWLLILDHVEHEDLEWLCKFCPQGHGRHILLTTRKDISDNRLNSIEIKKMTADEGAILILRRTGKIALDDPINKASKDDQADAKKIVREMDGLPLALEQAAAYIEQHKCHLSEYLDLYRKYRDELLRSGYVDHASVAATFSLSFKDVEQASPAAADLLRFCAFLNPDAIPVDQIIVKGAPELGPVLRSVATNKIKLWEVIEELRKFSLVRYNTTTKNRTLTVHRLVQEVLRDSMNKDTLRLWLERTVRALNRAFPNVSFKEWSRCEQCLPHVQACLPLIQKEDIKDIEVTQLLNKAGSYLRERAQYAQAMKLIEQALTFRKSMLAVEATSLHNMALLHFKQGQYDDSEPYYVSALTIRKKALGPRHPDTASSLNDLAGWYYCQGQYAQAEELCQQGLEIRKRVLGLEHTDTAHSLDDLGSIYYKQGKYDQAEMFFIQARGIREKLLGSDHPDTATSINNLARLYYSQGKYKDAEPLYQMALDIRQKVLGPDHPDTANSLNDLARLHYRLARYDQAERLYQQARAAWRKILRPEPMHPDLATVYNNLAKLYYRQGDYTQARECYLKALDIRQQTLSGRLSSIVIVLLDRPGAITLPEHPDVAATLNDLGRLYYSQGIYVEAEKLYQQALSMRNNLLDPQHSDVAESLNNLGSLYFQQASYAQAEEFYQNALTSRQNALGPKHPDVAESLNNLGRLYYKLGQYEKAKDHYQRAWVIREQVLGLEHPDSATTLNYLANLYSKQGRYDQAEQLYQQARIVWEKLLQKKPLGSGQSRDIAAVLHNLAWLYTEKGDYMQAEPLYRRALEIREKALGAEHPEVAESFNGLARLYYSWGKYSQAEPLYQGALAIREKVLGSEHPEVAETLNNLARLYYSQGKYSQAEPLYQQALAIREKVLAPEHPYIADSLNDLARLYYSQGKYSQAEPLYQQALAIRVKALGSEHPDTATSLNNLGRLYYRQGKYTQAEKLCQQALAIREKALGAEHPETTVSLTDLAWTYTYLDNYAKAAEFYQQSLTIRKKVLPPEHPYIADSLNDLAKFFTEMGNFTQAEPLFQQALALREKFLGSESPKVAETLNDQANLFFKQGMYEQAEPLYKRALAIREKALAPEHPYIADSLNDLARLYTEKGDYTQAEPLYQQSLAIREEALGPEHPKVAETLNDLANLYAKQEMYEQAEPLYQRARTAWEKKNRETQATELEVG
jgi:tetratricopeptide (TPR) repeat protein